MVSGCDNDLPKAEGSRYVTSYGHSVSRLCINLISPLLLATLFLIFFGVGFFLGRGMVLFCVGLLGSGDEYDEGGLEIAFDFTLVSLIATKG